MSGAVIVGSLRRAVRKAGLTHEAIAIQLDCERSLVSKQLAGQSPIDLRKLEVWIDMTGSTEFVRLALEPLGLDVVPVHRAGGIVTIRQAYFSLMRDTGAACAEADEALEDGRIDETEALAMRERLDALIETAQALKSRLPRPR